LDSVVNLFFSVVASSGTYSEWLFLSLAQAAESYHMRRSDRFSSSIDPPTVHRKRVREILRAAPEHRDWLVDALNSTNRPRLRQRLTELVDEVGDAIRDLIGETETFVGLTTWTRNYYTHYSRGHRDKAAVGDDLYYLTEGLSYLIQACLLRELGFSIDQCREILQKNGRYAFAVQRAQERRAAAPHKAAPDSAADLDEPPAG
jgi:hypothetical protein